MLANNGEQKIIIKRCFHRSLSNEHNKRVDKEVKRLEVTQAIEMEIYVLSR